MSPKPVRPRSPGILTRKGLATRSTLLEAARLVFREEGYFGASVSEINRRSGVAQGSFYQYFKNKEQLLLELKDTMIGDFLTHAEELTQDRSSWEEVMKKAITLLFQHIRENFFFHRILGEFELIDLVTVDYYDALAQVCCRPFQEGAAHGPLRSLDPKVLAYSLIGMAYFHAMDWGKGEETYAPEELVPMSLDLILHGISGPHPWSRGPFRISLKSSRSKGPSAPPDLSRGHKTRRALLDAAEEVFGQKGFNRANISEITRRAGVAQGTFYVHFRSKRDLLEGFVQHLSREMRFTLRSESDKVADQRDKEQEGVSAFFRFLRDHRQIYRLVAESETLGQEIAMGYYRRLAEGYTSALSDGIKRGEIRNLPPAFLARSLMGIYHMIGLKWLVWNPAPRVAMPKGLIDQALDMVLMGIKKD